MHNLDKDEWYDGIQQAVDEADDGNTLRVYPGTYEEWVIIDKPLTLLGPNEGIKGCNNNRGDEALIVPPADAPFIDPYDMFPALILVNAENVVIDGFSIEPLNPNIVNNEYQAATGILGDGRGLIGDYVDVDGLEVRNNIIKGFPDLGVFVSRSRGQVSSDGPITDVIVADNCIKESYDGNGFGFYLQGTIGHVLNNTVEEVLGNQIQPYGAVAAPGEGVVSGNVISAYGLSLYHNYDEQGGEWTYSGNTLTADPNASWWEGIRIQTVYNDPTLVFTDNTIDGMGLQVDDIVGLLFLGDVSSSAADNLDFSNNTIKGLIICVEDDSTGKHVGLQAIQNTNIFPDGFTEIVDYKIKYVE